jgi:hypothetical protein
MAAPSIVNVASTRTLAILRPSGREHELRYPHSAEGADDQQAVLLRGAGRGESRAAGSLLSSSPPQLAALLQKGRGILTSGQQDDKFLMSLVGILSEFWEVLP